MRKFRLITQTITLTPAQLGTIVFQELELDSNYKRCIGVCGVLTNLPQNDAIRLSLKDNEDTFIEDASSGFFKSNQSLFPAKNFIKINLPCSGNKITVSAVIPTAGIGLSFSMDLIYLLTNSDEPIGPRIKYQSQSIIIPIGSAPSKKEDSVALDPHYDRCTGLTALFISQIVQDYLRLSFDDSFGNVINKIPQNIVIFNNFAQHKERFYDIDIPAKGNHVNVQSEPIAVTGAEVDFDIIYKLERKA